MKLQLQRNDVSRLAQVLFNEIQHMRDYDALTCEEYNVALNVLKFILNTDTITLDDSLPF